MNTTDNYSCNWGEHNFNVNTLIKEVLASLSNDNLKVAVLGSGNCNDIPLELLSQEFCKVDLFDFDFNAIKKAISKLNPYMARKVKPYCLELTGMFQREVSDIIESLKNNKLDKCIDLIRNYSTNPINSLPIKHNYDLVLSINVVSQLLDPFFGTLIDLLIIDGIVKPSLALETLKEEINQVAHNIIPRSHLKILKSMLNKKGNAIVTTDKYEFGSSWLAKANPVNNIIKNPSEMLKDDVQKMLSEKRLQITGSTISEHYKEMFSLNRHCQWLWHFSDDRTYLVEGFILSHKYP